MSDPRRKPTKGSIAKVLKKAKAEVAKTMRGKTNAGVKIANMVLKSFAEGEKYPPLPRVRDGKIEMVLFQTTPTTYMGDKL